MLDRILKGWAHTWRSFHRILRSSSWRDIFGDGCRSSGDSWLDRSFIVLTFRLIGAISSLNAWEKTDYFRMSLEETFSKARAAVFLLKTMGRPSWGHQVEMLLDDRWLLQAYTARDSLSTQVCGRWENLLANSFKMLNISVQSNMCKLWDYCCMVYLLLLYFHAFYFSYSMAVLLLYFTRHDKLTWTQSCLEEVLSKSSFPHN